MYKVGDEVWVKAKIVSSDASGYVVVVSPNAQPVENIEELQSRITALESALAAEREKTHWVSVGERLPEVPAGMVCVNVIAYWHYDSVPDTSYISDGTRYYDENHIDIDGDFDKTVTHWQPPIEPPQEGAL